MVLKVALENQVNPESTSWINGLSSVLRLCDNNIDLSLKTIICSDGKNGRLALYVPPEMSDYQPENLRYLHVLANRNGCTLIEDRRELDIRPFVERRDLKPNQLAEGISDLLQQTGMPGPRAPLSSPHRLAPGNLNVTLPQLIDMVAHSIGKSKCVVLLPPPSLVATTGNETYPICAYGCRLITADAELTLSFFDSPGFKAIGYTTNNQFVMHVLIGGGPLKSPHIWANYDAMRNNRFRFQLFRSTQPGQDYGLLYNTFFLNIAAN